LLENLRLERALLDALEVLTSLDVVSFKGTLLTRRLHGNLSGRVSTDNDLLVHPEDFEHAIELLLAQGYRLFGPIGSTPERLGAFDQLELYPPVGRTEVVLDLHRYAFSRLHFAANESSVWQNLESSELHGRLLQTFCPELTLVHLVAHAISHGLSERTLEDLHTAMSVLGPSLDFERTRAIARQTVGLTAFETICRLVGGSSSLGRALPPFSILWTNRPSITLRVRLLDGLLPRFRAPGFRTPLVAFVLLAPERALAVFARALYPGRAELLQRFGSHPCWRLAFLHAQAMARKWGAPGSSGRDE